MPEVGLGGRAPALGDLVERYDPIVERGSEFADRPVAAKKDAVGSKYG